jgi:hypothetical protein
VLELGGGFALLGFWEGRVAFGVMEFGVLVLWYLGVVALRCPVFWLLASAWCGFAWGVRRSGCWLVFGGLAWVCICCRRKTLLDRTPFPSLRFLIVHAAPVSMNLAMSTKPLSSDMAL